MLRKHERILHRGFGRSSPLNLALVGSFRLATVGTGAASSGVWAKNPAAKISNMNGAKALGSKLLMETVPNREKPSLADKGTLLVSCPRNRRLALAETVACREAGTWSDGVEVGPPSNVTSGVKSSLIREGSLLPPVVRAVPGWYPGVRNAADWESRSSRSCASRKGEAGELAARQWQGRFDVRSPSGKPECGLPLLGWHRAGENDERTDA